MAITLFEIMLNVWFLFVNEKWITWLDAFPELFSCEIGVAQDIDEQIKDLLNHQNPTISSVYKLNWRYGIPIINGKGIHDLTL